MPVSGAGSDLHRIERQHQFVAALLATSFDFARVLADHTRFATTGRDPLAVLRQVRPDWHCCLFDSVTDATIDGKAVLLRA